ncbi:aminotransferase class IV [Ghiorsea bivora]|uniref:aminotransferase class IV n=1 Tax=Ghiorsea bivora TaxID=1485545 RepID=UPI000689AD97|nr:aminotransferase class IV [Ghiorsea bivora]
MNDALDIQIVQHLNRGLSYAESCFETFRVIDGAIFLWDKHWQRLQHGFASFGLCLADKHQENIKQNCLHAAKKEGSDCLVRLTLTGGEAAWGLMQQATPQIFIQTLPFLTQQQTIHLQSVEYPFALLPKPAKFTADYALMLRAKQHWTLQDGKSPLICKNNVLLSGLVANIALFNQGKWLTPQGDGILAGNIRNYFIQQGLMTPQSCSAQLLAQTEAAVLLNSGSFLQVVQSIDNQPLQTQHPAIADLQQNLQAQQGVRL